MYCPNCGEQVPDSVKVCGYCGNRIAIVQRSAVEEADVPENRKSMPAWLKWMIIVGSVVLVLLIGLIVMGAINRNRTQTLVDDLQQEIVDEPITIVQSTTTKDSISVYTQDAATDEVHIQLTVDTPITQIDETATLEPTQEPDEVTNNSDEAEMVYISAGAFLMGASEDDVLADSDEKPQRSVFLDAYWIYKREVSNAQYRTCIEAGICTGDLDRYPENSLPPIYINWMEAQAYCNWVGGRLPTEAEWEKAARGTNARLYPWGDDPPTCSQANFRGCGGEFVPVDSYPEFASPFGVLNMAGNAYEWVADWYSSSYYQQAGNISNPYGPESGEYRVLRGGGWDSVSEKLRVTYRGWYTPNGNSLTVGFRCVVSP